MHQFDKDISFAGKQSSQTLTRISDHWSINNNPNGGYLMALLANAALSCSEKKSLSIFTANFMLRCKPGDAQLDVEVIGHTKSFDRIQVRLLQNGLEKIRALGTLMPMDHTGENLHEQGPPIILPREQCLQVPEMPTYSFFEQMDIRLEPDCAGWMQGNLSKKSEQRGWVRFKDKRPFDQLSLLMIADSFPPPVLASHGMVAWVPTIELSTNIRNLPETDWLKCIFRSRYIDNGMVDEDGEIWDEQGKLIAISRQISQFRTNPD